MSITTIISSLMQNIKRVKFDIKNLKERLKEWRFLYNQRYVSISVRKKTQF